MRMNRRNVLLGLGTIVAGGGAVLGTGAFSSVEATRDVEISVADDSSALLGLEAGDNEFVSDAGDDDQDVLSVDLSGINLNAVTEIDDAFRVHNNSEETDFNIHAEYDRPDGLNEDVTVTEIVNFEVDGTNILTEDHDNSDGVEIEANENESVTITIDTKDENIDPNDDLLDGVTFIAN